MDCASCRNVSETSDDQLCRACRDSFVIWGLTIGFRPAMMRCQKIATPYEEFQSERGIVVVVKDSGVYMYELNLQDAKTSVMLDKWLGEL